MIPIYIKDIRKSLENKCYFTALSLALTLPDICGMAEFPNKSVAERYIEWYDKYLGAYMAYGKDDLGGDNPWLSGEIIYNLRNTYLHQGNPGIASDKVKDEANQLDKFILMLGDGTVFQSGTLNIEAGTAIYKAIIVDVTYLCYSLCDFALLYYKNHQEKFRFTFNVITQEEFMHPSEEALQLPLSDVLMNILNQKLEKESRVKRAVEATRNVDVKEKPQVTTKSTKKNNNTQNERKKKQSLLNVSNEKREAQVRSFFGNHFKKQIYLVKKEEIIQSVLKSKTKLQVKNNLMKHFARKEVSTIYQRLEPLIKNLPGK